jgi:hypothetical protein
VHDNGGSLSKAIEAGEYDDQLNAVAAAIEARWAELARLRTEQALARLRIGARVVIGSEAVPKYLRGLTGEVHDIDGDVVVVCLAEPVGKFKSGHVRCVPELLVPLGT